MVQGTELYRHRLGIITSWTVDRVELDPEARRVDVWAVHLAVERWPCPECGQLLSFFNHPEEWVWRHLDRCAFQIYLTA